MAEEAGWDKAAPRRGAALGRRRCRTALDSPAEAAASRS